MQCSNNKKQCSSFHSLLGKERASARAEKHYQKVKKKNVSEIIQQKKEIYSMLTDNSTT